MQKTYSLIPSSRTLKVIVVSIHKPIFNSDFKRNLVYLNNRHLVTWRTGFLATQQCYVEVSCSIYRYPNNVV